MRLQTARIAIAGLLLSANTLAQSNCDYDKNQMLSLTEEKFDQDMNNGGGGWRKLAATPGCELAAADLILAYRTKHQIKNGSVLFWHEGQLRAAAGNYADAINLFENARTPPEQDMQGWNPYVDATIAFLKKDKESLLSARQRLLALPVPAGLPPIKDGFVDLPIANGQTVKMRWPMNIDIVNALIGCFGASYSEAYGSPTCAAKE